DIPPGSCRACKQKAPFLVHGESSTVLHLRAPVRIDLAGGWTDVPPYADDLGGAVVNVAINRYGHGHVGWEKGVEIRYAMELPAGTGLGTSATLCVLYLALLGR